MEGERMETGLMLFKYEDKPVRTVATEKGEVLWVAKDVCEVLGISKYRDAVDRLDDDQRGCPVRVDTLSGKQRMMTVTESGLYDLILRSDKPAAKAFRKWITLDVLPTLRKTGEYHLPSDLQQRLQTLQADIMKKDAENEALRLEVTKQQNMIGGQQKMVDVFCRVLSETEQPARKDKRKDNREPLTAWQKQEVLKWYEKGHDDEEIAFLVKASRSQVRDVMQAHDKQKASELRIAWREAREAN
jgi:prophage antirepressor-like protein